MRRYKVVLFLLATAIFTFRNSEAEHFNEKFICENFACTQANSSYEASVLVYDSVELCRLVCGRYGNLWPLPTETLQLGRMAMEIHPSTVEVVIDDHKHDETKTFLHEISKLFLKRLRSGCQPTRTPSTQVVIHLNAKTNDLVLDMDTNEEHKLVVSTTGRHIKVHIEGESVYGVRHGLETLLQLTARAESKRSCAVFMLTRATIKDSPIFKHRGLLIDTARNFIPLHALKRTIDGMASVKLNVFHWHIVDSHSFPMELKTVPIMAQTGAYSSEDVYTVADQEDLINYGRLRGVRIILEIDTPAHAGNGWTWGPEKGLGDMVLCANQDPWQLLCYQPPCGQLNPTNPNMYKVMGEIFKEVGQRFTTHDLFHLGGDEVKFTCWNSTESIQQYLLKKGMDLSQDSYLEFWAEFHQKSLEVWDSAVNHNKTNIILWTSDLTVPATIVKRLDPKRFIIQSWTGSSDDLPHQLMKLGYKVIYSTTDAWYLDHGFWGDTLYHKWKIVYNNLIPTDEKVLGGEACMWSEYVDAHSIDVKVWPRGAALAERLWSDPQTLDTYGEDKNEVKYRLASARDRLIRLSIQADQIMPQWCYLNQGKCSGI